MTSAPIAHGFDPCAPSFLRRVRAAHHELLLRACRTARVPHPVLVDATAGLGRDALLLSQMAQQVILIEQEPHLYQALLAIVQRAQSHPAWASRRLTCLQGAAESHLPYLQPDVVYLDPLFGSTKHHAPKRYMQAIMSQCRTPSQPTLLQAALQAAPKVVVKRHARLGALDGMRPHHCLMSKQLRYDVYV